jgi:ElaB/YqjD/DUF883 family membrane-anchored ribosome-binding protein
MLTNQQRINMRFNDTIDKTQDLAHEAADNTTKALQSTRRNAVHGVEKLDDQLQQWGADAAPAFERATDHAAQWARRGAQQLRDGSQQLQAKARYAADGTQQYVRDQPVKSVLIAAGVGALLMGLLSLFARSDSRR